MYFIWSHTTHNSYNFASMHSLKSVDLLLLLEHIYLIIVKYRLACITLACGSFSARLGKWLHYGVCRASCKGLPIFLYVYERYAFIGCRAFIFSDKNKINKWLTPNKEMYKSQKWSNICISTLTSYVSFGNRNDTNAC